MQSFRLRSDTIAVYYEAGGKGYALMVPAGSTVSATCLIDPSDVRDDSQMVWVKWDERPVRMFLIDLLERGECMNAVGYPSSFGDTLELS